MIGPSTIANFWALQEGINISNVLCKYTCRDFLLDKVSAKYLVLPPAEKVLPIQFNFTGHGAWLVTGVGWKSSMEKLKTDFVLLPSFYCCSVATAKSLQSCPTLCDPIDGSPPGSPVPGILQAGTLEWVAIFFSNAWKWKVKGKSLSRVRLLETPWTAAYQAPPSMGFSRQEYWSGVPVSCVQFFATPWTAARQAFLSFNISRSLLKLMSIESVMLSNRLILCRSLLLLPSIFPASRSFPMSQIFTSGCQSIGVSASASVLPKNIQGWFPLGLTALISSLAKAFLRVFSCITIWKHHFFTTQLSLRSNSHLYMTTGKTMGLTIWTS